MTTCSINQYIFRGVTPSITVLQSPFYMFFFGLVFFGVTAFVVISGCALAHREPESLRNLVPGAIRVVHFLGVFQST